MPRKMNMILGRTLGRTVLLRLFPILWMSASLGCVDFSEPTAGPDDFGTTDQSVDLATEDMSWDEGAEVDLGHALEEPPNHIFCNPGDSERLVPAVESTTEFFFPADLPNDREPPDEAELQPGGFNSNYLYYEDPAKMYSLQALWHPGEGGLKLRLGDKFGDIPRGDYLAVSVLVDHKPVEANYFRRRNGQLEFFGFSKYYIYYEREIVEWLDVHLGPELFPEKRAYDLVIAFFHPVNSRAEAVQLFRNTLYYGGFDIPSHPCFVPPPTEEPAFTEYEQAFIEEWSRVPESPMQEAIYVYKDGGEIVRREADTIIEVESDAVSVDLNAIFRYSKRESYVHRWVPMKIIALVDYEHVVKEWVWGMPLYESRLFGHDFFRRETFEVPLNPGPETTLWMLGIPHPWIPKYSPGGEVNEDISQLHWAHRSNRIILRRK